MKWSGVIVIGLSLLLVKPLAGQSLADPLADGSLITYQYGGYLEGPEGPYNVFLPYAGPTSPLVNTYCVDELRYTYADDVIGARVTNLGSGVFSTDLYPLQYAGTLAELQTNLQMAAWLSTQFWTNDISDWQDIQYAIWSLTSGRGLSGNWLARIWTWRAEDNFGIYNGGDYSDWSLLTTEFRNGVAVQDGAYQTQSMLVQSGVARTSLVESTMTHTPEPQTYLLMATGLILLVFAGRRRLRENGF